MVSPSAMLLLTALIACAAASQPEIRSLPESFLKAYYARSKEIIRAEIAIDKARITNAYNQFKPVNKTCRAAAANVSLECLTCVDTSCKKRYLNTCPVDRPTSAPGCDALKQNARYHCLYYADPSQCSVCTDLDSENCKSCVEEKCTTKAKDVCNLDLVEGIRQIIAQELDKLGEELKGVFSELAEELDNFYESISNGRNIFESIPFAGGFEDVANFFGDLVGDIFDGLGDFASDVGDEIGDFVDDLVDDIGDFVDDLGDGIRDVVDDIGDAVDDAGDGIRDVVDDIGDALGGIFNWGKRKRRSIQARNVLRKKLHTSRRKRSALSEPTCDEIKANASRVCLYYNNGLICERCGFDPNTDCDGWTRAVSFLYEARDKLRWLLAAKTNSNYTIASVEYDIAKRVEPYTFEDIDVKVQLFGRDLEFTLEQPLDLRNAKTMGAAIGQRAVELSRDAALAA